MQSAEYGMQKTLLRAVAGLWRVKLAKQKNKKVGKKKPCQHYKVTED